MRKWLWLLLGLAASALFAQDASLRLGIYENPPMTFIQKGAPAGFIVDIIGDFARRQRIQLKYVRAPFYELFAKMQRGEVDIIAPIAFNEERSRFLRYNSESILIDWSNVIVHEGESVTLLSDLDGKVIGVVKSDYYAKLFARDLQLQNISCNFREYDAFIDVLNAVNAKKIDAGFIGRFSLSYILKTHQEISGIKVMPGSFYHESLFFGIHPQKADVVPLLDAYLREARRDKKSTLNQAYERWFGQTYFQKRLVFLSKNYLWILLAVAAIIAVFIFFNLLLRSQVKRSVYEVNRQKSYFENLFKNIPVGIIILDANNRVADMNQEFASLFGYTLAEIKDRELDSLISTEETLEQALGLSRQAASGERVYADGKRKNKSGQVLDFHIIAAPIVMGSKVLGIIGIYLDISERKRMQEEIIKAKNIESVGVLAGGIAHDFNNMLTGIMGNISVARKMSTDRQIGSILEKAEKAALKASGLTQQLLTFSKGGFPVKKVSYLPDLVKDALDLVLSGSNVRATVVISDKIPPCEIDVTQISQVIHNLLINAREAMPDGGSIDISIRNHHQGKSDEFIKKGHYVSLVVADHGQGIAEEDLPRIFAPYFTTKQTGSGLGLAIAYSIVTKHHGYIKAVSTIGQGATFTVFLPATQKSVASHHRTPAAQAGPGRILLMDDEEIVREVFVDMLRGSLYRVDVAASSGEALEKFQGALQAGDAYDLLFLDLTGPGDIGGIKTLEKVLAIDPKTIAVAISGYSISEVGTNPARFHFKDFLSKPFHTDDLLQMIARNLKKRY
ncbi:MAG: transporter substrate-binding domain-containing protein [Candidatus Aminicenantes bacterium]|nr:transporter substrate-binding domain-containing protein [Candidatus Aminicenantes bacterium]